MRAANELARKHGALSWHTAVVELLSGNHLWDHLRPLAATAVHRRVAIAYAGRNAARQLVLGDDDIVVVNGGAPALVAGSTNPDALAEWLEAGAAVWSLEDLHAKVVLLEQHNGTSLAVVGSANISDHSNDVLHEAVLLTCDPGVCEAVSEQLDRWVGQAKRVDAQWLRHATTIYREP